MFLCTIHILAFFSWRYIDPSEFILTPANSGSLAISRYFKPPRSLRIAAHKAIGQNAHLQSYLRFDQNVQEGLLVPIVAQDAFATVPAIETMMNRPRKSHPCPAHGTTISR
jgi:hypothetical protein